MLYMQDFTILYFSFLVKMVCPKFFWKHEAVVAQKSCFCDVPFSEPYLSMGIVP